MKFKNIKHTILMKFGIALAIIVHYTVQFNLECCTSSVSNMGPNTFFKLNKIIIRRLKSEIKKFKHTILMKFGRTLAIIVHYTWYNSIWSVAKASVSNMGPNTFFKMFKNYHKTS